MNSSKWLQMDEVSDPEIRLFCFPFAGGGASYYRHWSSFIPDSVQLCRVQLPGRENRISEAPYSRMEPLLDALIQNIEPFLDRPFAFFGHSMGAMLAYELTKRLKPGISDPEILWISACRAPHLPDKQPIHQLPKTDFYQALAERGGIHPQLLESQDYMDMCEPLLRADLAAIEMWHRKKLSPINCPIRIYGGKNDTLISNVYLEQWQEYSKNNTELTLFSGGHFYLNQPENKIPELVGNELQQWLSHKNINSTLKNLTLNFRNGEKDHVN